MPAECGRVHPVSLAARHPGCLSLLHFLLEFSLICDFELTLRFSVFHWGGHPRGHRHLRAIRYCTPSWFIAQTRLLCPNKPHLLRRRKLVSQHHCHLSFRSLTLTPLLEFSNRQRIGRNCYMNHEVTRGFSNSHELLALLTGPVL